MSNYWDGLRAQLIAAREDEIVELVDEVKALDVEYRYQRAVAKGLLRTCEKDEAELDQLRNENERLRTQLATERSRYTLGGTPPGYHEPGAWANRAQPPPSASDESAPPLKRGLS